MTMNDGTYYPDALEILSLSILTGASTLQCRKTLIEMRGNKEKAAEKLLCNKNELQLESRFELYR